DQAKTDDAKKKRAQAIKDGKVTPEMFDKAFEDTSKKFYAQAEKDLDGGLQVLAALKKACDSRFTDEGPSFGPLQAALEATRHVVHGFLQKKREKEPDPIEEVNPAAAVSEAAGSVTTAEAGRPWGMISLEGSSEPPERMEAVRKIAEAAAFLRRREPKSPA